MATYFDPNADQARLHPDYRSYSDLTNLAADVEKDVIEQYTIAAPVWWYMQHVMLPLPYGEPVGAPILQTYVRLRGYKVDSADAATDPDLKDALKRTIAEVISWRIERRLRGQAVASTGVQGVSRSYLEEARNLFPRGWDRHLRRFDLREPVWGS